MDTKDFNSLNKPRSKKLRPRIDLTAMVNISFLLIIFYMVSVELSKPKIMEPVLHNYCCGSALSNDLVELTHFTWCLCLRHLVNKIHFICMTDHVISMSF
jgi:hypothetical protein